MTTIILARDEAPNIGCAVRSAAWCRQVIVVDSGSTDGTQEIARGAGATVLTESWRGYSAQREWAMRHPAVAHGWVFFLDADEWVSTELAGQIAEVVGADGSGDGATAAFSMRRRLVFAGRWIAHCGWYTNSWQARVLRRDRCSFDSSVTYGERAVVSGPVGRLSADLVDEDAKGLAAWLQKHIGYAELEAMRRAEISAPLRRWTRAVRESRGTSRPLSRTIAKEIAFPLVPAKPLVLFLYMYILRSGWRDGRTGLVFCLYHAWYELTVGMLRRARSRAETDPPPRPTATTPTAVPWTVPDQRTATDDRLVLDRPMSGRSAR